MQIGGSGYRRQEGVKSANWREWISEAGGSGYRRQEGVDIGGNGQEEEAAGIGDKESVGVL